MYILRTVDGLSSILAVQSGQPTNLEPLNKTLLYWTVRIAADISTVKIRAGSKFKFIEPVECRKLVTCNVSI
jgi:hypothetical protein